MVLLVEQPAIRVPERSYAISVLLGDFLGLPFELVLHDRNDVRITVAGHDDHELWIPDLFLSAADARWLQPASLPTLPLKTRVLENGSPHLPVLFASDRSFEEPRGGGTSVHLDVDVFGSCFFLLSRYEEAVSLDDLDRHQRFPLKSALAGRAGTLDRPLVNEYLELLWDALHGLWPELKRKKRSYRLVVSHDVDDLSVANHTPAHVAASTVTDIAVRREPRLALRRLRSYTRSRLGQPHYAGDPYNTFDFLMDVSESHGLKSAFYFVVSNGHKAPLDPAYDLKKPWASAILSRICERGHEVGLHGSYESFADGDMLAAELRLLQQLAEKAGIRQQGWGGRQHFLRWKNPDTWRVWNDLGMLYDSTLTHAEEVGFRCGCCYEYPVFDLQTRRPLQLRERPLVAMDATLLSYMKLEPEQAVQSVATLVETCRRFQGDFTLLWHSNFLISKKLRSTYGQIVEMAA